MGAQLLCGVVLLLGVAGPGVALVKHFSVLFLTHVATVPLPRAARTLEHSSRPGPVCAHSSSTPTTSASHTPTSSASHALARDSWSPRPSVSLVHMVGSNLREQREYRKQHITGPYAPSLCQSGSILPARPTISVWSRAPGVHGWVDVAFGLQ
jgi:hypothetical protein